MTHNELRHSLTVGDYSDALLDRVIDELKTQNLSNYRDHETRWKAERLAAARAEKKHRARTLTLATP